MFRKIIPLQKISLYLNDTYINAEILSRSEEYDLIRENHITLTEYLLDGFKQARTEAIQVQQKIKEYEEKLDTIKEDGLLK